MATRIPRSHPRHASLRTRERLRLACEDGLVHATGLIAHGRGEAYDYLLGERTHPFAVRAARAAAATMLAAERPVLSLNGNVVALAARPCVALARTLGARLEVNLFHRTAERVGLLVDAVEAAGGRHVQGRHADARIPGLASDRARCARQGIHAADAVLVPLEDGDRCQALKAMGKRVVTIDLNPLSRTARTAHVTVVDDLTRAVPRIRAEAITLKSKGPRAIAQTASRWDNEAGLAQAVAAIARQAGHFNERAKKGNSGARS